MNREKWQMRLQVLLLRGALRLPGEHRSDVRCIPLYLARTLAKLTSRSRVYALVYIGLVFYLIPVLLIFDWR